MEIFLPIFWFFALAVVWGIYIIQEMITVGGGILSYSYFKDEKKFKQYNRTFGTHWDGIQVWLILAIGGLFAAFPVAFAETLTALYIPVFLLIYTIFFRGIAIEVIYKTENIKFQNILKWTWIISSLLLIVVLAIYITTLFIGMPSAASDVNDSFFSFLFIFNVTTIISALFFVSSSIVISNSFMTLNSSPEFTKKNNKIVFIMSVTSLISLLIVLMGFNNKYELFSDGLFLKNGLFFILPIFSVLSLIIALVGIIKKKAAISFVGQLLAVFVFILTGFTSMFPYIITVQGDPSLGLLINDASATSEPLFIMMVGTVIFLPIVIGYQVWKYKKFWGDLDEF